MTRINCLAPSGTTTKEVPQGEQGDVHARDGWMNRTETSRFRDDERIRGLENGKKEWPREQGAGVGCHPVNQPMDL